MSSQNCCRGGKDRVGFCAKGNAGKTKDHVDTKDFKGSLAQRRERQHRARARKHAAKTNQHNSQSRKINDPERAELPFINKPAVQTWG